MLGAFISHNHRLTPKEQALISIESIEFSYGFGVYELIRLSKGRLLFAELHIERLMQSAKIIGLEHEFDIQTILRDIQILVDKNRVEVKVEDDNRESPNPNIQSCNIKIILVGGKTAADAHLYIMMLAPKFLDKKTYRDGVAVITKIYERFLPQAKTLNMLPSYLLYKEATVKQSFDMLLLNRYGYILEGTRSNFFAIRGPTVYTPPLDIVLNGISRQTVIACAKKHGYTIEEVKILASDLFSFAGAFLTNTSGKIVPIRTVDGRSFPNITAEIKRLMELYDEYINLDPPPTPP